MNRFTLAERIGIECGIYQNLKLSEIAKKIGKTPGSVSREIRANRTVAPGEHPCGKDCYFAGECKTKAYTVKWDVPNGVQLAVNTIAESFAQNTTIHLAL